MFECAETNESGGGATPEPAFGCICHSPAFARLNAQLSARMSRRSFLTGASAGAAAQTGSF
ncbi:MAG: twin-arginine translocation signal domain-containing protein, partial [Rhodoblastus sp.]